MGLNFVLFMPDEMRAESVGCYGEPLAPTPNIDAFAREAVRFDQCHVQHTVCSPSRCSFATGWYPHVRGHRSLWHLLGKDEPNLFKYLKRAGYEVHVAGKNDLLSKEATPESVSNLAVADRARRYRRSAPLHSTAALAKRSDFHSFLWPALHDDLEALADFALVDGCIEFLRDPPASPFVLFVPLTFPHCPYWAPGKWHDLVPSEAVTRLRPPGLAGKPEYHALIRRYRNLEASEPELFQKIQAVYLGMIAVVDELFGQLRRALAESRVANSTALFLFSDHGDYAGDYGLVEKWPSGLEDVLTRVPLIAELPGCARGHVVDEPVELFDVMASVLELAEVRTAHTHFARSLVAQLGGAPGDPERIVFAEGGYDEHEPQCFEHSGPGADDLLRHDNVYRPKVLQQLEQPHSVARSVMLRTLRHKLVRRTRGTNELYRLDLDPRELDNLYGRTEHAALQRELESKLLDWMLHTADVVPHASDPRGWMPHAGR